MFNFLINNTYLYLIIAGAVLAILLLITFLLIILNKKKFQTPVIDTTEILEAFGANNIIGVEQTQARVRIQVKDTNEANLETLKELTNGIFVTGDKFVLTFKENT